MLGKMPNGTMTSRTRLTKKPGEVIRTDLCPVNEQATLQLRLFIKWAQRQLGNAVKCIIVDGGAEYLKALKPLMHEGI